jgi:hypothetical protein
MKQLRLRHHKGNGSKLGNSCEVSADSFLHRTSVVRDWAEVYSSFIGPNCTIADCARVACGAHLVGVTMKDHAAVIGPAIIGNVTLHSRMRISAGYWRRAPRYFEVTDPVRHITTGITEGSNKNAMIGCELKTLDEWLRKGPRIGFQLGWPAWGVGQLIALFEEWRDNPISAAQPGPIVP